MERRCPLGEKVNQRTIPRCRNFRLTFKFRVSHRLSVPDSAVAASHSPEGEYTRDTNWPSVWGFDTNRPVSLFKTNISPCTVPTATVLPSGAKLNEETLFDC